jgi:AbrB family looped-hinge helix DNA binding protein
MVDIATIDGAGRLVVPKRLRVRLGLRKGSRLMVREEGDRLVLEPVETTCVPVERGGLLLIEGRLTGPVPDHRDLREERLAGLRGTKS